MVETLSRTEKKRRAKNIEELAKELVGMSMADINRLPCEGELKEEIKSTKGLKGPALKRQLKFIAKELRRTGADPILEVLAEQKGSKLKQKKEFHELEYLRDRVLDAACALHDRKQQEEGRSAHSTELEGDIFAQLGELFPNLDLMEIKRAAMRFTATRKVKYRREIFRLLHAAAEEQKYISQTENN